MVIVICRGWRQVQLDSFMFGRKLGYRGAIGFKNNYSAEIEIAELVGFSKRLECRSLASDEHSFNYLHRQDIPDEVQLRWRLAGDSKDRTANLSLAEVPKDLRDGEIIFILIQDGTWTVEHAPKLRLEELQHGE